MRIFGHLSRVVSVAAVAVVLAAPMTAAAQEQSSGEWEKYFEVYGWLPDMGITTADGTDITLKLKDILKNLDMIAMFDFGARNEQWSWGVDFVYTNLGDTQTISGSILNRPVGVEVDIDMRALFSTFNAGYAIFNTDRNRLDFIGGVRYLYVRVPLRVSPEQSDNRQRAVYPSGQSWDAIVGFEGVSHINDNWDFDYYVDLGSGQSALTWQTKLGFSYHFNKWTGTFGFRYLTWNLKQGKELDSLDIIGPYLGARWTW